MRLADIQYVAPADASHLAIPSRSIDLHVSFTVLEHIPPDALASILKEARRVLAPGGLLLHIIDPSDHFSHDDGSITAVNFLQFSDREWASLAANRFMFHNRLRAYEYVELFTRAGVRIVGRREALDERSLKALQNGFSLDERFRHIDLEQLAIRCIILMGEYESA
jgi:SAM-dependent methyltransferase